MKGVPAKTGDFLKNAVRGFPRTPYEGAKAIQKFIKTNYRYGCEENISTGKWIRYPDEIKKYMTCQDAGIFNFLMAKELGLDVVLAEFQNFQGTDQSHLGAIIKGDRGHFVLSNQNLEKVILMEKHYLSIGPRLKAVKLDINSGESAEKQLSKQIPRFINKADTVEYSNIRCLDLSDVVSLIESRNEKDAFRNFFQTGQQTSTYYVKVDTKGTVIGVHRFLRIEDDVMTLRRSFDMSGYFINILFGKDNAGLVFSTGSYNSVLINPITLFSDKFKEGLQGYAKAEITQEQKTKIEDHWIRTRIALLTAEKFGRRKEKTARKASEEAAPKGIYSQEQRKKLQQIGIVMYFFDEIGKDAVSDYRNHHLKNEESLSHNLMQYEFTRSQKADDQSRHCLAQRALLHKLENNLLDAGIRPAYK